MHILLILLPVVYLIGILVAFCWFTAPCSQWDGGDIFASLFWPIVLIALLFSGFFDRLHKIGKDIYEKGKK